MVIAEREVVEVLDRWRLGDDSPFAALAWLHPQWRRMVAERYGLFEGMTPLGGEVMMLLVGLFGTWAVEIRASGAVWVGARRWGRQEWEIAWERMVRWVRCEWPAAGRRHWCLSEVRAMVCARNADLGEAVACDGSAEAVA